MIELVLEGAIFLIMGLELEWVLDDVRFDHYGIPNAIQIRGHRTCSHHGNSCDLYDSARSIAFRVSSQRADDLATLMQDTVCSTLINHWRFRLRGRGPNETTDAETIERFRSSWRRRLADIDYFRTETIGWREGSVIVWAGMRGAVTLAAAQTLPADTPGRSLLVFVAFLVASTSLLLQGSTLPWLVKRLLPPKGDT